MFKLMVAQYHTYKSIQAKVREECTKVRDNNHSKTLKTMTNSYRDPQKFWELIRKLKATQTPVKQYTIKNNIKLIENNEKEEAFRKIWENIFKIMPEENTQYDDDNKKTVRDFLNNHQEIFTTCDLSDLSRLQGNQNTDELIFISEIQTTIKSFKKQYSKGNSSSKQINPKKSAHISP